MIDIEDGIDEDYLLPFESTVGPGLAVQAMARQPAGWIAQHLRQHGALVASGILTGYAGTFAEHIAKYKPGVARALSEVFRIAAGNEKRLSADMFREVPRSVLKSLRSWPQHVAQPQYHSDRNSRALLQL